MMTKKQKRLCWKISRKPMTLQEVAKFFHFKDFDDFYDEGTYHQLLDPEFWNAVTVEDSSDFPNRRITHVDNRVIAKIEEDRTRTRRFFIPTTISILALLSSLAGWAALLC